MSRARTLPVLLAALAAGACTSTRSPVPTTEGPPAVASSSLVFAGHARAQRFAKGAWAAAPEYDYDYVVLERRYAGRWETVKEIHRRHPKYDGRAGPRDQTLWFVVRTSPAADGGLDLAVDGTLGRGSGHEMPGGGGVVLEIAYARKGWLVPFDTVRIRQERPAADGRMEETVELFSRKDGREVPFMRMEETGLLYRPVSP